MPLDGLSSKLPIVGWLSTYQRSWLRNDLVAGVSTWALVVPQAVAYGQIAGLPAQSGLAAAFAGPFAYALLGTSRQLIVSPTSSTAAVSAALVAPVALGDPERFIALSAGLAIFTGLVLVVLGIFKLGFVSQFLSTAVQVGFMIGLGLTIGVGQAFDLLGLSSPAEEDFFPRLVSLIGQLPQANPWTFALGLGGLAALIGLKSVAPRAPAALIVVVAGILITTVLNLSQQGVATVGRIEQGLPAPGLPHLQLSDFRVLLPAALAIAVLGYAESASVAQGFAARHRYDIDANRELIAIGGSNILSGLVRGFIVGGGASQSAANDSAGARTQLAGLILAGLAVLAAFTLTGLFVNLPQAILAAIVIDAIRGFFRFDEMRRIFDVRRDAFALAVFAMLAVLVLGMLAGLIIAIALSILILLTRISRPSLKVIEPASATPGMLALRPNAMLIFANARHVRTSVVGMVHESTPPRVVVLDLEMSYGLDVESADTLAELRSTLRTMGSDLWLATVRVRAIEVLGRSGYFEQDAQPAFATVDDAAQSFASHFPHEEVTEPAAGARVPTE